MRKLPKKTDLKVNYSLAIAKNIEITSNYIKNRHSHTEIMERSRIIATIGPACDDVETLVEMINAGMDVARLNYSHGDFEGKAKTIANLREAEKITNKPLGLLADLPGPKLRLGRFEGSMELERGEVVKLVCGVATGEANKQAIPVEWKGLSLDLRIGDPILLADGLICLEVLETENNEFGSITCRVEDGGILTERKGINVPRTLVKLPAVGEHDIDCLNHALEMKVDFVAVSYVRSPNDLDSAKEIIAKAGFHTWLISKIEHPAAIDQLDGIVEASDAVMVARGDLGVEIPFEQVPLVQEKIINSCLQRGKPVIVATQMLESMVNNPRPTRAEITDVATAIRQHTSAVMLSGETASGDYPVASVQTMAKIATEVAKSMEELPQPPALASFTSTRAIAGAAASLAKDVDADAILVATQHGNAARLLAAYRPKTKLFVFSSRERALRRTTLLPGTLTIQIEEENRARSTIQNVISKCLNQGLLSKGMKIVAVSGSPQAITGRTSTIRLLELAENGTLRDLI